MKVLFTTPILEHPPAGGPQLRIENSIKALNDVCELHVLSRASRPNIGGTAGEQFYRSVSRTFRYAPSCRLLSGNRYLRKARALLGQASGVDTRADARALLQTTDRLGIDAVWFGYGNISYPLIRAVRATRPPLKLVCDTDSVWSRFVLRRLPHAPARQHLSIEREGRAKEAEESAFVEACDVTTAVSDLDAEYYRSIASDARRVHRFSNVIDLENYAHVPPPAPGLRHPCLFLGGTFGHAQSPMDMAARWVLDEVLPRVRQSIPEIHLCLVGRGSSRAGAGFAGPGVTVTGEVASVLPYLCHASVSLVPLKFESGTRFKILEAAACGIPIVSTRLGAEGLPVVHGQHLLLADHADGFANAIVSIVQDRSLARRLSDSCRVLVERDFSLATLRREATDILAALSA